MKKLIKRRNRIKKLSQVLGVELRQNKFFLKNSFFNNKDLKKLEDIRDEKMIVRKGDTDAGGKPVTIIQLLLEKQGYELPSGIDGVFGKETDTAVREFQGDNGLIVDGIVGTQTVQKLEPGLAIIRELEPPAPAGETGVPEGYKAGNMEALAAQIGISPLFLEAVMAVESAGDSKAIRFEPHLFNRKMEQQGRGERVPHTKTRGRVYSTKKNETDKNAFLRAFNIDKKIAIESTSWGSGQVLGARLLDVIPNPDEAVMAFYAQPEAMSEQLMAAWFVKNPEAVAAANNLDFRGFAKIYNGPLYYQGKYDIKIRRAYEKALRKFKRRS